MSNWIVFIGNDELPTWSLFPFWILITELHFEFRFALFWSTVEYHLFQFFLHYEYVWRMCRVKFLKLNRLDRIVKYKIAYKQWDASVLTNYQTDKILYAFVGNKSLNFFGSCFHLLVLWITEWRLLLLSSFFCYGY